jgi:putative phosphoribosyl transferase
MHTELAVFQDRAAAGRALADRLAKYADSPDVVVLALPRGGVPVAAQVARSLGAPLEVVSVRKLGVPGHEELAMGAIAGDGTRVVNQRVVGELGITEDRLRAVAAAEHQELERRERAYRGQRPRPELTGKVVLVVDDGLATGATMRAAVAAIRRQRPARVVVGVPVGAVSTCRELERAADEVVCVSAPALLVAVGQAYRDFGQTTDEEVRALLDAARARSTEAYSRPPTAADSFTRSRARSAAPERAGEFNEAPPS